MHLNGQSINGVSCEIPEGKFFCAVDMTSLIKEVCINWAACFHNDTNIIGVYRMYSNIVSNVGSQNYGRWQSVTEFEKLCNNVCAFKFTVVKTFLPVCTSNLSKLNVHSLDHLIEDISRFGSTSALDASSNKHFNTSTKALYRDTS